MEGYISRCSELAGAGGVAATCYAAAILHNTHMPRCRRYVPLASHAAREQKRYCHCCQRCRHQAATTQAAWYCTSCGALLPYTYCRGVQRPTIGPALRPTPQSGAGQPYGKRSSRRWQTRSGASPLAASWHGATLFCSAQQRSCTTARWRKSMSLAVPWSRPPPTQTSARPLLTQITAPAQATQITILASGVCQLRGHWGTRLVLFQESMHARTPSVMRRGRKGVEVACQHSPPQCRYRAAT